MKNDVFGKYLPLGSVISLEGSDDRLMIAGRVQQCVENHNIYDYCAVHWPEGVISSDSHYLFNHDAIARVFFIGLQDGLEFQMQDFLHNEQIQPRIPS